MQDYEIDNYICYSFVPWARGEAFTEKQWKWLKENASEPINGPEDLPSLYSSYGLVSEDGKTILANGLYYLTTPSESYGESYPAWIREHAKDTAPISQFRKLNNGNSEKAENHGLKVNLSNVYSSYDDFANDYNDELLKSAVAAIDPDKMGMTRDQAMTLAGAMKNCGFSADDYAEVCSRSGANKGKFSEQWTYWGGKGKRGKAAGPGTIFDYAKQSGWYKGTGKYPRPEVFLEDIGVTSDDAKSRRETAPTRPARPAGILARWRDSFRISCLMDSEQYDEKPQGWQVRSREPVPTPPPTQYTVEEFVTAITSGQSFYPTVYSKELIYTGNVNEDGTPEYKCKKDGRPEYYYRPIEQQLFIVDIDNEKFVLDENGQRAKDENGKYKKCAIDNPLTIEAALEICKANDIEPFFVYETFSSKYHREDPADPYTKFRLCFATDAPLTVQECGERGIRAVIDYLVGLFGNAADTSATDFSRIIYGTDENTDEHVKVNHAVIDADKLFERATGPAADTENNPEEDEVAPDPGDQDEAAPTESPKSNADYIEAFVQTSIKAAPPMATGFNHFDEMLGGGLYPEFYILAAVPSAGKTSLALQIADQVAAKGTPVLLFSLEMGRNELIARSVSRLSWLHCIDKAGRYDVNVNTIRVKSGSDGKTEKAYTAREVSNRRRWNSKETRLQDLTQDDNERINRAVEAYAAGIASNIYIFQGLERKQDERINMAFIDKTVEEFIQANGGTVKPLVIVDYLQMLAPSKEDIARHATDKMVADNVALGMKLCSAKYKIPVIGISSMNRASYKKDGDLTALKESGGYEYGADNVLILQFENVDNPDPNKYNEGKEKARPIRNVIVKIPKQRNGLVDIRAPFKYLAMYNLFFPDSRTTKEVERSAGEERREIQIEVSLMYDLISKANQGDAVTVDDFADRWNVTRSKAKRRIEEYAGGLFIVSNDGTVYKRDDDATVDFQTLGTKKTGKREMQRARLERAFKVAQEDADGAGAAVSMFALAEILDVSQVAVKRMLKEYGGYEVSKDGNVTITGEVDTSETVSKLDNE